MNAANQRHIVQKILKPGQAGWTVTFAPHNASTKHEHQSHPHAWCLSQLETVGCMCSRFTIARLVDNLSSYCIWPACITPGHRPPCLTKPQQYMGLYAGGYREDQGPFFASPHLSCISCLAQCCSRRAQSRPEDAASHWQDEQHASLPGIWGLEDVH